MSEGALRLHSSPVCNSYKYSMIQLHLVFSQVSMGTRRTLCPHYYGPHRSPPAAPVKAARSRAAAPVKAAATVQPSKSYESCHSYLDWLTSDGLAYIKDIAALKYLPQGRHHDSLDSLLSATLSSLFPCTTLGLEVDYVIAQWWLLGEPPPCPPTVQQPHLLSQ